MAFVPIHVKLSPASLLSSAVWIFPTFVKNESVPCILFPLPTEGPLDSGPWQSQTSGASPRGLFACYFSKAFSPALRPGLFANFASLLCLSCSACIESLTYETYFSVKFNLFFLAAFLVHFCKSMKWGWNQRITHWILIYYNESPFCRKGKKINAGKLNCLRWARGKNREKAMWRRRNSAGSH